MNRYMLIDFENKSIMSLNKVDIDLPENDKYCGCVNCSDYNDLVMTIIKELRHNQQINLEKDLDNRVNIDYVLERLEDCLNVEVLELLDVELEDDETVEGGISFMGETLRDFMFELNIPYNISLEDLNKELKDCGIKPLQAKRD